MRGLVSSAFLDFLPILCQRWGQHVNRRCPLGNMSIGRNWLHTRQKRMPLKSGTLVSLREVVMALEPALSCVSTRCGASISESESLSLATKWAYPEVCLEDPGPDAVEAPVVDVTLHIIELADVFYAISGIHEKQMGISFLQMYVSRLGLRPIPSTASSLQQCLELCAPASTRSFSTYTCPLCAAAWGQLQRAPSLAGRLTKSEQRCALSSRGFFFLFFLFFLFFCFLCFFCFFCFSPA